MLTKEEILKIAAQKGKVFTRDLVKQFDVSRQYASSLVADLVTDEKLIKLGSTRKAFYVSPEYAKDHPEIFPPRYQAAFDNSDLEEHRVLDQIEQAFPRLKDLPENIKSIFDYAFSEMLNNAIEHSTSVRIGVEVAIQGGVLSFVVRDSGIGVFRNVKNKRKLKSVFEAIQDLMKGKTTTMPKSHSGEGIFFTSKVGDLFMLDSFGRLLTVNNKIPDIFVNKTEKVKRGTKVVFRIAISSQRHLNEVFGQYTHKTKDSDYGFDKTMIQVKLYTLGGVHISRSQARRILAGLEKFKVIVFDFNKVPLVGQAFADEIFRVFHKKHPKIKLETANMNEGVSFMVERAKHYD
ncbi:STAS-like domain-containing protein [Candidatus Margulisiibacteriota bacterium]